jgi:monovalent cation:H+ antiporter-2, CPA2 family
VATPDVAGVPEMVQTARTLNPGIAIVLRAPNADEAALLREALAGVEVLHARAALADAMAARAVALAGATTS